MGLSWTDEETQILFEHFTEEAIAEGWLKYEISNH